jgi:hypothetical protein
MGGDVVKVESHFGDVAAHRFPNRRDAEPPRIFPAGQVAG